MKVAVVLFNLGGPDRPDSVRPFLFNLFNDPAIIALPQPIRWLVAQLISHRRAPVAREIYERLGGGSPLVANTEAQAAALSGALGARNSGLVVRCFPAMRYWHPFSQEAAAAVKAWAPDRIVLLPLYPQYSGTTTGSSLKAWQEVAGTEAVDTPSVGVCCYAELAGFVSALAEATKVALETAGGWTEARVLFSAHGLPKKVVAAGDPYQWQVERTASAVVDRMGCDRLDWVVCYQSRVGPLEWIQPYTEDEIRRAGTDRKAVVVVPIAFVSEHSETLVELDIEYRHLAESCGVPRYVRVPTVSTNAVFIDALAGLVERTLAREIGVTSNTGARRCPASCRQCPAR